MSQVILGYLSRHLHIVVTCHPFCLLSGVALLHTLKAFMDDLR